MTFTHGKNTIQLTETASRRTLFKNGIYCSFPKFRTTDLGIGSRNNLSERVDTFLEGLCFRIAENAGYFGVPGAKEAQIQSFEKRQAHQLQ